jgi:hypothetical protein
MSALPIIILCLAGASILNTAGLCLLLYRHHMLAKAMLHIARRK